ncbi:MAG TPA: DNA methyltransferase [Chitinispirillaceae bacterium]|nr:DNA methyltransferase [Chitinispirillaceae bacterium]
MASEENTENIVMELNRDLTHELFPMERQLIPNLSDVYELELAFYENLILSDEELIKNAAYFSQIRGEFTNHFLMCTGEPLKLPEFSSSRLKSFFEKNIFRTGYATHGLFPYRGKFHPQMIKGLMNVMGLKPGNTVLDPMMGSGTVLVEASLMGIRSIGVDASPFCRFMTQTKLDALSMSLVRAKGALTNYEDIFTYFQKRVGKPNSVKNKRTSKDPIVVMEETKKYAAMKDPRELTQGERETLDTYNLLLLSYLDSVGYAERSTRKTPLDQFRHILERYLFVTEKIQIVLASLGVKLAPAKVLEGDARMLSLEDNSIEGIIFSPPYSFAIDYLANDSFHLNFMGVDSAALRERMIGLRGRNLSEKYQSYREDMSKVLSECARVLQPGHFCTIIIGTNNNQLGKVLGVSPDEVKGLHEVLIDMSVSRGFKPIKVMSRPITGISNTMRREYIIMLQKNIH